ncbi:MAG: hypothetical protein IKZ82_04400 [Clostridia bacterium]|nr:hypothetical protein [Clostridia bacterium]
MKRFFSFCIAVVALLTSVSSFLPIEALGASGSIIINEKPNRIPALSDEEYYPVGYSGYKYPVRPGMREWYMIDDHAKMIEVCSIPEDILASMSAYELAETVLAYPLLIDVFAYDNVDSGVAKVSHYFNWLKLATFFRKERHCFSKDIS